MQAAARPPSAPGPTSSPEAVELVVVRLPGRESRVREPAIGDWPTLLRELGTALQEEVRDRVFSSATAWAP